MKHTIFIYDATFEGFLTSVFETYERKLTRVKIRKKGIAQDTFFDDLEIINSDENKAKRIWNGLQKKVSAKGKSRLYKAFLSELENVEDSMLEYVRQIFSKNSEKMDEDYSNETILQLSKIEKKINREKHRMDAFIRFKLTKDGIFFATVEPDFNVLPLNVKHFKNRYADQKWLIYDLKRNYGFYYNLECVEMVKMDLLKKVSASTNNQLYFTESEVDYQALWKNYFRSTNIPSRKNMRLHLQHVPRRYWKYLSEKQP